MGRKAIARAVLLLAALGGAAGPLRAQEEILADGFASGDAAERMEYLGR